MLFILIVFMIFSADMMLKRYVEANLKDGEEKQLAGGRVRIRRVHNPGMLLGALKDKPKRVRQITTGVMALAGVRLVTSLFSKERKAGKLAFAFVAGGALSNWFDHFHQGYVVDYINIRVPVRFLRKIYFNLADFFIALGGILAIITNK